MGLRETLRRLFSEENQSSVPSREGGGLLGEIQVLERQQAEAQAVYAAEVAQKQREREALEARERQQWLAEYARRYHEDQLDQDKARERAEVIFKALKVREKLEEGRRDVWHGYGKVDEAPQIIKKDPALQGKKGDDGVEQWGAGSLSLRYSKDYKRREIITYYDDSGDGSISQTHKEGWVDYHDFLEVRVSVNIPRKEYFREIPEQVYVSICGMNGDSFVRDFSQAHEFTEEEHSKRNYADVLTKTLARGFVEAQVRPWDLGQRRKR